LRNPNPLASLTIEDIAKDPHRYGAPTFEEFARHRAKHVPREDAQMIALTEGPQHARKHLKRIRYFMNGLELDSEESVEVALKDHGYSLEDINLEKRDSRLKKTVQVVPVGGGYDHEIHVNFLP